MKFIHRNTVKFLISAKRILFVLVVVIVLSFVGTHGYWGRSIYNMFDLPDYFSVVSIILGVLALFFLIVFSLWELFQIKLEIDELGVYCLRKKEKVMYQCFRL